MGTVATVVYKRLAEKHGKPYSSNFPQVIVKSYVYTACVTGTFVLPRTCMCTIEPGFLTPVHWKPHSLYLFWHLVEWRVLITYTLDLEVKPDSTDQPPASCTRHTPMLS